MLFAIENKPIRFQYTTIQTLPPQHFSGDADGDGRVGNIILQKAVEVLPTDTPDSLRQRVMEEGEWKILSQAVALYCAGKLSIHGNRVVINK